MPAETAEREIISLLLDAYERSSFFKTGAAPTRRIKIRLHDSGLSNYPRYKIENHEERTEINRAALHLAQKDLVDIRWMKGEENHIIAQISLNTETPAAIMDAYTFLGRKPKNTRAGEISARIQVLLESIESPWIRRFLEDCNESLSKNRSLTGGKLSPDDEERENLFRALRFIDERRDKEELLERVFSIRCFGNSKTFETAIKKRLLEILRRYTGEDDSTDGELLAFAGIVRYPERFEFRGPLVLRLDDVDGGGRVDFSPLRDGASLSTLDFTRGRLELPASLDRILSIENKANYTSYIRQNTANTELVLYHGGQYSPSRGRFFRALAAAMPENCSWYHFGDIDYGGFSMLARLRREIHGAVRPFHMDKDELIKYAALTRPVTPSYAAKLQALTERGELADCRPCLVYMIQNNIRLEQEALLEDQDSRIGQRQYIW
ncbi:MAG: DUF2220 domain-containing protein [Spirochaetaceae bacterium]|jgi:hypothetical protein|nr:DUF2220 domain-containing protein [Spirochaetaceae bacterium]